MRKKGLPTTQDHAQHASKLRSMSSCMNRSKREQGKGAPVALLGLLVLALLAGGAGAVAPAPRGKLVVAVLATLALPLHGAGVEAAAGPCCRSQLLLRHLCTMARNRGSASGLHQIRCVMATESCLGLARHKCIMEGGAPGGMSQTFQL